MATNNKYTTAYQAPTSTVDVLAGKRILQYPLGLGSTDKDQFGLDQHYVIFKINTDTKTTALKDDVKSGVVNLAVGQRQGVGIGSTFVGEEKENPDMSKLTIMKRVFPKSDDKDLRLKWGGAAVDNERWVVQKGMTKLDKVIVLPMPNDHHVVTSVNYDEGYKSSGLTKLGDYLNQGFAAVGSDTISMVKNSLIAGLISSAKSKSDNGDNADRALLAEERMAYNPKKEVMFVSFGFRNFTFSYQFAPKTEKESDMVHDIIETLRYYSLPEITAGTMFYIFPSEFEITFMHGAKENPHIPKIATSVLSSIVVNYTPNSVWSSLPNGAPLSLNITLSFIEMELIDRSRVFNAKHPITSGY